MSQDDPNDATAPVGNLLSGSGRPRAGAVSVVGRPFAGVLDPHRIYGCKGGATYPNPPKPGAGPEGAGRATPAATARRPQTAHRVAQPEIPPAWWCPVSCDVACSRTGWFENCRGCGRAVLVETIAGARFLAVHEGTF